MSEAFFTQILRAESSVQPDGESCCICLQQYGTISPESGLVETEVRLPCNHAFGSACIVRWLQNSNTCPICRETFIPPTHRPSIEPAIMDGQEANDNESDDNESDDNESDDNESDDNESDDNESNDNESDVNESDPGWDHMTTALHTYTACCDALSLRNSIRNLVQKMIRTGDSELDLLSDFGAEETVAACIYMASDLLGHPKSFEEVRIAANASERYMQDAYKEMYTHQRELLEGIWVDEFGHGDLETALETLWPPSWLPGIERDA